MTELNQMPACSKPLLQDGFSLSLDDLDGEIWIDAIGFDGVYEVSNMGRVKSLGRWVSNGKSERWVKDRIRKLWKGKKDQRVTMIFSIANVHYSLNLPELIYSSFNPNENLNGYVIAHLDKIAYNNKLSNLKKLTVSQSRKISENLGNLKPMPVRGELKYTRENTVVKNGVVTEKKCKKCNSIKNISLFEKFRNTCLECRGRLRKKVVINDSVSQTVL